MKLQIEYLSPDELVTYENNAKIHTAEQIEQIKHSIQEFGMNDPIAVWKDNVITDYGKAVKRMKRELKIYDALKRGEYGKRTEPRAG